MTIKTKYSIGDQIDLGLYERHHEKVLATIVYVCAEIHRNQTAYTVTYWYETATEQHFFQLREDGKTEAAPNELGEQFWDHV